LRSTPAGAGPVNGPVVRWMELRRQRGGPGNAQISSMPRAHSRALQHLQLPGHRCGDSGRGRPRPWGVTPFWAAPHPAWRASSTPLPDPPPGHPDRPRGGLRQPQQADRGPQPQRVRLRFEAWSHRAGEPAPPRRSPGAAALGSSPSLGRRLPRIGGVYRLPLALRSLSSGTRRPANIARPAPPLAPPRSTGSGWPNRVKLRTSPALPLNAALASAGASDRGRSGSRACVCNGP